jgi:hypothetical protein
MRRSSTRPFPDAGIIPLGFPAFRIVSKINFFFLKSIQPLVFCDSNRKWTKTRGKYVIRKVLISLIRRKRHPFLLLFRTASWW